MSVLSPVDPAELAASTLDRRFRRPLMTYFMIRVRDRAEAEDLTQQTFLRVLGADRRGVVNPQAFVFRIAANLLKDRARDQGRRAQSGTVSLDDEAAFASPSDGVTPERILLARDGVARALSALDELGAVTRDIFVLFRFENMRQLEIAERLGMSQAAVEKQVMRATLHLIRRQEAGPDGR